MSSVVTPPSKTKSKKNKWNELFFIKRRPRLRGIPLNWEQPATEDDFQKLIRNEGFVSWKLWDGPEDVSQHPILLRDLKDLEQYLLPSFFEFSQKSKYYQNRFYLYQWIFVVGAFTTTVFGTIAALFTIPAGTEVVATSVLTNNVNWQQIASIATAVVGAVTAFITTLSNRGDPQKRWGKTRRLTEELRFHYFTYLSHMEPYHTSDRLQKMRRNVIDIRVKEQENG